MKKIFFGVMITFLLVLSLVSAVNLNIENQADDVAMIYKLGQPAIFDLKITNNGQGDNFMFYNFWGSDMFPKGTVQIGGMETKLVQVGVYPREDLKEEGWVQFNIFINGQNKDEMSYPLMVKIVRLQDALEVGAEEFKPDSNNITVYVQNLLNFNLESADMKFRSPFFSFEKIISLKPHEKKSIEITLNKEDFRDLMAGYYTLYADITADNQKASVQGTMKFSEKDIVTSTQNQYGQECWSLWPDP